MSIIKGTKLHGILTGSCPVCHEESMYVESNPYKISSTLKMRERCSNCHTKYKMEPSFFYGAMYVSYPVGIAFGMVAFFISYVVIGLDLLPTFFVIMGTLIAFLPVITRVSRNIWISFFMKYDKSKSKINQGA